MVSKKKLTDILHPEEKARWEQLCRRDKTFYPEEIASITVDDDFTLGQHASLQVEREGQSRRITAIARLLGVVVDEWPSQVVSFTRQSELHGIHSNTKEARRETQSTLGEFVSAAALNSVPIEMQLSGITSGMKLSLRTGGRLHVVFSSENNLWYPDFEEIIDEDECVTEGAQVSAGGYSYKIMVSLEEVLADKSAK